MNKQIAGMVLASVAPAMHAALPDLAGTWTLVAADVQRPDGSIEDLGRLPGEHPSLDGMRIGADGRLYVTDTRANGIHILRPDGTPEGFFACGRAPTNCTFDGETLWVTNAGVLATGTDPSFGGTLARMVGRWLLP